MGGRGSGLPLLLRYLTPTYVRLYIRLLRDSRVALWPKLLLAGASLYAIVPLDLIPDSLVLVGWGDDLALLALALVNLVNQAPPPVVEEHLREMGKGGK